MPNKIVKPQSPLELCTNHTGKMEGMVSLSTNCANNPCCQRNCKIKGSICEHCYAQTMMKMYKALGERTDRNTTELTTRELAWSELPVVNASIFRFEAFGDLHNETHLINYIHIAEKNPNTRFTLWSKNYPVVLNYFKTHKCPSNFTMIISSMFINKVQDLTPFKNTGAFAPGQLKVFTVFDENYIKANSATLKINCGSRYCLGCRLCYDKNEVEEVNEILKSDKNGVESFLLRQDPHYEGMIADACDEFADVFGDVGMSNHVK